MLHEIHELPGKLPVRFGITAEHVEAVIRHVREYAVVVTDVPERFTHPSDPSDAAYINLALATESELVLSRDRHLLGLMDPETSEGRLFTQQFSGLRVVGPVEFLHILEARRPPHRRDQSPDEPN